MGAVASEIGRQGLQVRACRPARAQNAFLNTRSSRREEAPSKVRGAKSEVTGASLPRLLRGFGTVSSAMALAVGQHAHVEEDRHAPSSRRVESGRKTSWPTGRGLYSGAERRGGINRSVSGSTRRRSVWTSSVAGVFAVVGFTELRRDKLFAPNLFAGPLRMRPEVLVALFKAAVDCRFTGVH